MGVEYKIKFNVPTDYKPTHVLDRLPSPIQKPEMFEIYNYSVEKDGFYFLDHLVNPQVASVAFKCFIDEALKYSPQVHVEEL